MEACNKIMEGHMALLTTVVQTYVPSLSVVPRAALKLAHSRYRVSAQDIPAVVELELVNNPPTVQGWFGGKKHLVAVDPK